MSFQDQDYDYSAVVAAMIALHREADERRPKNLQGEVSEGLNRGFGKYVRMVTRIIGSEREEFNVGEYFSVLKHISPPEGQVLDFVYFSGEAGSRPCLYLRDSAQPRFNSYEEYVKAGASELEENLPSLLRVDGTPESFFELVVFNLLGGRFYLPRRVAACEDTRIITSQDQMEEMIEILSSSVDMLKSIGQQTNLPPETRIQVAESLREWEAITQDKEVTPIVRFLNQDTVSVSVVVFSIRDGFSRLIQTVSRQYPHKFMEPNIRMLVPYMPYRCGFID